jgi:hypothetical protein
MKKFFLIGCLLQSLALYTNADVYRLTPSTSDLWDLDHSYYYTWGFNNFTIPSGQVVTGAVLTISGINNWTASENTDPKQQLNIWLLDSASNTNRSGSEQGPRSAGVLVSYHDTDNGTDNLASWAYSDKTKIATYHDSNGGPSGDVVNLVYNFSTEGFLDELNAYINNGLNFGLGFDPDCHYYNDCIKLKIWTGCPRVPDGGSTLLLLGTSLMAVFGISRKLRA